MNFTVGNEFKWVILNVHKFLIFLIVKWMAWRFLSSNFCAELWKKTSAVAFSYLLSLLFYL